MQEKYKALTWRQFELIHKYYSKNVIIRGVLLCISFLRSWYNEEGNEDSNSNESHKTRIHCNILKNYLSCLLHQY